MKIKVRKIIKSLTRKPINFLLSLTLIDRKTKYNFSCPEKHIVVIIPSYNNEKWVQQCLDSVKNQDYNNFHAIYINDKSKDKTGELVAKYIKDNKLQDKFTLINNQERVGAMANFYNSINSCSNTDIIAILDGDDWFADKNVLKKINSTYQDKNVWLTYGQYQAINGISWPSTNFSASTIKNNKFRNPHALISHLRTFYAGLFKLIKLQDLQYQNKFLPMTCDKATMMPMIEMCGGNFKRIKDILYIYNDTNPLNDYKVDVNLQETLNKIILGNTPYVPVTWQDIIDAGK